MWRRFVKLRALLPATYYAVNVRHKRVAVVADGEIDAPLLDCARLAAFGWASRTIRVTSAEAARVGLTRFVVPCATGAAVRSSFLLFAPFLLFAHFVLHFFCLLILHFFCLARDWRERGAHAERRGRAPRRARWGDGVHRGVAPRERPRERYRGARPRSNYVRSADARVLRCVRRAGG